VPLLVDLMPSGRFLMEEFAYAGGVPALLNQMCPVLHLNECTVSGATLGRDIAGAEQYDLEVIRDGDHPVQPADLSEHVRITGVALGPEVECRCRYRAADSGLIANT